MPIETSLNVPPYFDDYNELKQYYKVLFQPGVSVQVRELNQLQTMLQKQVERFGDHIFRSGTIISGCNFSFYNDYKYVKILDNDVFGVPVALETFTNKFVKNSNNLVGFITNVREGFESTAPNLKTLYISYLNSGSVGNSEAFSLNETLTVYDSKNSIFSIEVNNGGTNFSNNELVLILPSIAVGMDTGSNFAIGDSLITDNGANVEIVGVDSTTFSNEGLLLITYTPFTTDLTSDIVDYDKWSFYINDTVRNVGNTKVGSIYRVYGTGAEGRAITTGTGIITDVLVTNGGEGYEYAPTATVISRNNTTGVDTLNLIPKNYVTRVQTDSTSGSVGSGYAFGVSEGIIYQKGYFLRVEPQIEIVTPYSTQPNNVVAGFRTLEEIVNFNEDETLLDNVNNDNKNSPGADRLKLIPVIEIVSSEEARANTDFFDLVEWNDGLPFKQNKVTQYSRLGEEMAQRTFDESGNYVIDTFQVGTVSTSDANNEGKFYTVVVDPGQAYVSGYKVQTLRNYNIDVRKGLSTQSGLNYISLNYGNFVRVKEVGGIFEFAEGAEVKLYDTAKTFISSGSTTITAPTGLIGTARIRSMVLENGIPGEKDAVYKMYLFDIKMNPGQNFRSVKAIYSDGTNKGVADVVLTTDATTSTTVAILQGTNTNKLLFSAGVESLKNSNNTTYIYRTIDETAQFSDNTTAVLTKSVASSPNEYFPYTGELSDANMKELYVVPLANNLYQYTNLTGNVICNTTSTIVTGNGTNFFSNFVSGDYILIKGAASNNIKRIISITNTTSMIVDSNCSFANTGADFKRVFPQNIPIPFGSRQGLTANVDANGNILTLYLKHSNGVSMGIEGASGVNTAIAFNVERRNITSTAKEAKRKRFVKIRCSNATYTTSGPWCLGIPDAFRLRNVYLGTSSSVDTSSTNVTDDFYIDHNQNANYLDLSWLYKKQKTDLTLTSSNWLLVEFDYFTGQETGGYFDTVSYLGVTDPEQVAALDSLPLSNLTTTACSWEVPEVYTYDNKYYDLLNTLDFRPAAANTVAPVLVASIASAPVNPPSTVTFSSADKKFPYPDTRMSTTIEQYLGRVDSVFISGDEGGRIYVLEGISNVDPRRRLEANHPKDSLKLQSITVPPYPNITMNLSTNVAEILATGIANEKRLNLRVKSRAITPIYSTLQMQLSQPMVYTMEDIGNLERRIADLEYYVSLSILETSITNKSIPSSVNPVRDRFKFGFFADDFSTQNYSDIENPQYSASIEQEGDLEYGISKDPLNTEQNWATSDKVDPQSQILSPSKLVKKATNRVVPPKQIISLNHYCENIDYSDYMIIQQPYATVSNVCNLIPNPPSVNTTFTNTAIIYIEWTEQKSDRRQDVIKTITVGNTVSEMTYFGDHYQAPNHVYIYQGNTLIASSLGNSAIAVQNWTSADKIRLNSSYPSFSKKYSKYDEYIGTSGRNFVQTSDGFKWLGKISWTHNPTNGNQYTIKTTAQKGWYKYLLEYKQSTSINQPPVEPCVGGPPPSYDGTLRVENTNGGAWSCSKRFQVNGINTTYLNLAAFGLKPTTRHDFYIDGILLNTNVVQQPVEGFPSSIKWNVGTPLMTDLEGKVFFRLWFNSTAKGFASTTGGKNIDKNWLAQIYQAYQNQQSFGSSGYSVFEIKATNSSASLNVARRKPEITFAAANPNGNP